ncbi:MAG: hypothetical protein HOO02_07845, partial [Rhodospirillaceae bacterium]|nr:hypothetical protein [Rhodospirillaceae bacterium]
DNDFEMVGRDDVYDPFAGPEARRRKKTRAPRLFAHLDASDVPIEHETDRMSLGINYGTSRRVTNTYNIADKLERKRIAGEVGNALAWSKTATPEQLKAQMAAVAKAQQYNVAHNEKVFMKAYPRFEDDPETALANHVGEGLTPWEDTVFFKGTPEERQAVIDDLGARIQPWQTYELTQEDYNDAEANQNNTLAIEPDDNNKTGYDDLAPAAGATSHIARKRGEEANAADGDYPWQAASITAEADGWEDAQVQPIETQLKQQAKSGKSASDMAADLRPPSAYKTDLEIKQEKYEDETPWWKYVGDRLKAGTLPLIAGVDAFEMISSVRLLDDYDAIKKGTFTRQKTTSGSGPLSARQMRLAKFLRAKEGDGVQDQMYKEEEEELAKSVESGWNLTNKAKSIPSSPIARGALGAWEIGDIGEFWQYFEQDPMAVIGHYGVEEIPSATLSRITGAAGSAIAGSIGAVAGRNIGLGLSEYASAAWTEMQRRGAMMNDPASVRRVLKQHGQEIRINALKRAMGEIFKSEATKAVKPNGQKYMKTAPKP